MIVVEPALARLVITLPPRTVGCTAAVTTLRPGHFGAAAAVETAARRRKTAGKFAKLANVTATSQCGTLTLTLVKPDSLLAPIARQTAPFDPLSAEVDHLLCYKAKSQTKLAKGTQVDVVDDFQTRRYDLKKPTRLCVPVSTFGTPVALKTQAAVAFTATALRHAAGDLVCYQAKAASKTIPEFIFDLPTRRSTNLIGTSTIRNPLRWQR